MNVTLKLDKDLCRQARHRAVDRGMSLSAWMVELLERELARPEPSASRSLLDTLAMADFADRDFALERDSAPGREASF